MKEPLSSMRVAFELNNYFYIHPYFLEGLL